MKKNMIRGAVSHMHVGDSSVTEGLSVSFDMTEKVAIRISIGHFCDHTHMNSVLQNFNLYNKSLKFILSALSKSDMKVGIKKY